MASRIINLNQSVLQRSPRVEERGHLDFIRALPCVICMKSSSKGEPCHIRFNDARYLKKTGGQEKPDDKWVIPMCRVHHQEQTDMGEGAKFWEHHGFDPHALALMLHSISPEIPAGERVIRGWNGWIQQ